jgi:protein arginine N-methyltransferase 1
LSATRAGTAHGLSVWFDATLVDGVVYSNSPMSPELIYGSLFFPFSRPVALAVGDTISVALEAALVGEDYVWRWSTCVLPPDVQVPVKARFEQSTFFGAPLSTDRLHKRASKYAPRLGEGGQIDRFILDLMDGTRSLDHLARTLAERFPTRFKQFDKALAYVGNLSEKYSAS